ncbi:SLC13 family permease [Paenibacillus sp. FSL R10-2734]|uniref:SLC13 family permease n=1 Tax=Paenibacillus sp. FSL R10-2734 TaxID=2954691 RepID=UPI0030D83BF3
MDMGLVALILLFIVIIGGFLLKKNVGLLAIAAATVLGYASGDFTGKEIVSGFSSSLFMTLLGVTLFFGIIQENGAIGLVMRRVVNRLGKQIWAAPILVFAMGYIVAAIGPGCVPAMAFAAAMAVPLAKETGYHPVMMLMIGNLGTYSGRFTPITPEGVLINKIAQDQDLHVSFPSLLLGTFAGSVILALVVFGCYKGWKVKHGSGELADKHVEPFTKNHFIALTSVVIMVLLVILLKMDVGLASFLVSMLLLIIKVADEKKAFASVPWSTLILVCGVGVLMKLVISTGGIKLLSDSLAAMMTPGTAAGIFGSASAVMSWFSSAIGVVFPTLLPTLGGIVDTVGGGLDANLLIMVMALFASVAGISSASTGGAIIMGAIAGDKHFNVKYPSAQLFIQLLLWAIAFIAILAALAFVGVFNLFLVS